MAYPGKGLGALLEAMRLLNGIKLTMIGQIHPGYRSLYETLQRQGDDRVTWTGRLEPAEISKILSTSALCVLPFEEGASLRRTSLVSALAHGTPVVTTRPRSPIDGLGDAAFLVDRAEPKLLADAIRMLLEDDSRRGRLSESAARFASSLSWEVIAQRTEEVYRQCLATTSG
jgi:glycosyltransferase involved in cell wall biosynthesis